jgi:universal stress protein A
VNRIQRILVPVDFSACSRAAFEYAVSIAARIGARIEVLHVYSMPPLASTGAVALARQPQAHLAEWTSQLRHDARRALHELVGANHRVAIRLCQGTAAEVILNVATSGDVDLIVMGTHGRTGLSHLVRGSVAEEVLRSSPKPVMTVKAEETT